MNTNGIRRQSARSHQRAGAAAVECALAAPLLTLLVLGAIDMGQLANVYQKVSDASREGARFAARYDTQTTTEVETAVMDYLQETSGASSATLASAVDVTVTDAAGTPIPNGNLEAVVTGSQVRVQVTMQYDPVRWLGGVKGLDGYEILSTTMMRRE